MICSVTNRRYSEDADLQFMCQWCSCICKYIDAHSKKRCFADETSEKLTMRGRFVRQLREVSEAIFLGEILPTGAILPTAHGVSGEDCDRLVLGD